jgi:hypothetical protein
VKAASKGACGEFRLRKAAGMVLWLKQGNGGESLVRCLPLMGRCRMRSLHRIPPRTASPNPLAVFWLALMSLSIACQRQAESPPKRYHLKGTIVRVDRRNRQLVVNHEEIPGFMGRNDDDLRCPRQPCAGEPLSGRRDNRRRCCPGRPFMA